MTQATKKDQPFGDKAKDQAGHAYDAAKQGAHDAAGAAKDAASSLAGAAKDAASHLGQAASGMASSAAGTVGKKAEEWTSAAGGRVESLADTVRSQGPREGVLGKGTEYVAEGLEKAGEYMQDKNLSGMAGDVTELIKRNPIPALLVGLGVGYLLGKAMRS